MVCVPTFALKHLVLAVEPMPKSRWGINYRNHIGITKWDALRKEIIKTHDGKCDYCDSTENLHCHEVWHYDMKTGVQRLDDIEVCCNMCHFVKHLGNAHRLANAGQLDIESVYDHFCKVNGCSRDILIEHTRNVANIKMRMERIEWSTDTEGWNDGIQP